MSIASSPPTSHSLTVMGPHKAQGSLKSFKHPHTGAVITPQDKGVLSYRGRIIDEWKSKYKAPVLHEDVEMTLVFAFRRPDLHYKAEAKTLKRGHREVLKETAPNRVQRTPDIDKLCRSVLDALTGWAYHDDAEVTGIHAVKVWSGADSTTIILKGGDQ